MDLGEQIVKLDQPLTITGQDRTAAAFLAVLTSCILLASGIAITLTRHLHNGLVEALKNITDVVHDVRSNRTFSRRVSEERIEEFHRFALDFNSLLDESYMITSNGARVHDLDGNLIFAHNLDRDIASDLFGVVNDNPDIITNVYRDDEWFMNRHHPEEMRFFSQAVAPHNLYYAPDPSSQIACSIGGNVAENAGGVHCLKYGLTVHNLLKIEVQTLDGEALTLGSDAQSSLYRRC